MELYQLKTFVVVAEEGHLTRASVRLHASQPSVSAHIKALEEELDTKLFIRTPKGMRLTEAGERLRDSGPRNVLKAARELRIWKHGAWATSWSGDLSMGLNTDAEYLRIVPLLTSLGEDASQDHRCRSSSALPPRSRGPFATGTLDCGFIFGEPRFPELATPFTLETTRNSTVGRAGHLEGPAWTRATWPHCPTCPGSWTPRTTRCSSSSSRSSNGTRGFKPSNQLEVDGDEVIRVLVAAGKGVSFLRRNEVLAANRIGQPVHSLSYDELSIQAELRLPETARRGPGHARGHRTR